MNAIEVKVAGMEDAFQVNLEGGIGDFKWRCEHIVKTDKQVRDLVGKCLDEFFLKKGKW